jgi:hypothetical protein
MTPLARVLSWCRLPTRGSLAQSLHDRNAQAGFRDRFRHDQVQAYLVKAPHRAIGGGPENPASG